jgi:hypothetical protein
VAGYARGGGGGRRSGSGRWGESGLPDCDDREDADTGLPGNGCPLTGPTVNTAAAPVADKAAATVVPSHGTSQTCSAACLGWCLAPRR